MKFVNLFFGIVSLFSTVVGRENQYTNEALNDQITNFFKN